MFYTTVQHTYASVFDISGLFTGLLDLGFISGIAIALKLFRMQMANLKTEKDLTKGRLESELKFLKIQLNPHFLFNTLNNIYVLARKKSELAPEIILRLSKLLRFMLYEVEKKHIRIEEEIRILEDYIEVEKLRFSSHLMITFNKEIDDNNQRITPLILLPFIENAFKHGPREIVTETFIDIMIVLKDGNLKFTVNNSKENRENGSTLEKIGLINVRRQLELIYGEFKLVTENLGDSFRTELLINLKKHAAI
ncbi:MAG: sensor histidine kinase [Ginsengibacter sp.]